MVNSQTVNRALRINALIEYALRNAERFYIYEVYKGTKYSESGFISQDHIEDAIIYHVVKEAQLRWCVSKNTALDYARIVYERVHMQIIEQYDKDKKRIGGSASAV